MKWAIEVVENPDPGLDFMKGVLGLPQNVAPAVLDFVKLIGSSENPSEEFTGSNSLLVYLLHPHASAAILTVDVESAGTYIFAIPFMHTKPSEPEPTLYILALWQLARPAE